MSSIFISYSSKNKKFVQKLVHDVKKKGHRVWWDFNIKPGDLFPDAIENAINSSDYCIVVLSPQSVKSEWVKNEFLFAKDSKVKIVPIMIRKCKLPVTMASLNYIDFRISAKYEQSLDQLLETVSQPIVKPVKKKTKKK